MAGATLFGPVKIWDTFVRIFHWTVVASFFAAWFVTSDPDIHETAGYLLLVMVFLRLAWGVVGTGSARFETFVRGPRRVGVYLLAIGRGHPRRYLGHNPAGAAMIISLITSLLITTLSGMAMKTTAFWGSELVEAIHGLAADVTVGLAVLHVAGVLAASISHRENLVLAMITGTKSAYKSTKPLLGPSCFSVARLTIAAAILLLGFGAIVPGRSMLDSGLWRGSKSAIGAFSSVKQCTAVATGGLEIAVWPEIEFRYRFAMKSEADQDVGIAVAKAGLRALFLRSPAFALDLPTQCRENGSRAASRKDRLQRRTVLR